jgi:hypothetical protein
VVGRRAKAVGSWVVWWEGVLKLSGLVLCGWKSYLSCRDMYISTFGS